MDTIFALASARGKAGVAVIRISGPLAHEAAGRLCGRLPPARKAGLRRLHAQDGSLLDEALVLIFEEGGSFTGEAVAELHVHGGMASINAILEQLQAMAGLRMAEPGEFTRRALENGRLDLAEVEGLADLIAAETEAQRRQAVRLMAGELGKISEAWRALLLRGLTLLEASIDFAEEEDVPEDVLPEVRGLIGDLIEDLGEEARGARIAERIRHGFEVAIIGAPNAGKSTLLNAIARRNVALTSEHAGTTRDVLEVRVDLKGLPVVFLDTAGLRDAENEVESMGIERALERARNADLRVFLLSEGSTFSGIEPKDDDILLHGKADLTGETENSVSGLTGYGVGALLERIAGILENRAMGAATATRARQRACIDQAIIALREAKEELGLPAPRIEIAAERLHAAARALDLLIGRLDVESVLDEIFADFCIGK